MLRLLRAVRVQRIDDVEQLCRLSQDSDGQKRLTPADWVSIRRHNRLLQRYFGDKDDDNGE